MKRVVIEESSAVGGRLVVLVLASDLWALQVLCARAGQKVLAIKDDTDES